MVICANGTTVVYWRGLTHRCAKHKGALDVIPCLLRYRNELEVILKEQCLLLSEKENLVKKLRKNLVIAWLFVFVVLGNTSQKVKVLPRKSQRTAMQKVKVLLSRKSRYCQSKIEVLRYQNGLLIEICALGETIVVLRNSTANRFRHRIVWIYDLWSLKIGQYIAITDHSLLWDRITKWKPTLTDTCNLPQMQDLFGKAIKARIVEGNEASKKRCKRIYAMEEIDILMGMFSWAIDYSKDRKFMRKTGISIDLKQDWIAIYQEKRAKWYVRKRGLWLLKIQTQKPGRATDNSEDIDWWTKEFDAWKPVVTYAVHMMATDWRLNKMIGHCSWQSRRRSQVIQSGSVAFGKDSKSWKESQERNLKTSCLDFEKFKFLMKDLGNSWMKLSYGTEDWACQLQDINSCVKGNSGGGFTFKRLPSLITHVWHVEWVTHAHGAEEENIVLVLILGPASSALGCSRYSILNVAAHSQRTVFSNQGEVKRLKRQTLFSAKTIISLKASSETVQISLSSVKLGRNKDEGTLSEEHYVQEEDTAHPFFDDIADKDAAVTPDLERKKVDDQQKTGFGDNLKYSRQGTRLLQWTLNFEDEAGPYKPTRPIQVMGLKNNLKAADTNSRALAKTKNDEEYARKNSKSEMDAGRKIEVNGYKICKKLKYPQMKELLTKFMIIKILQDFIPMDLEKEREMLKERDAIRLLRKRKSYNCLKKQPSKKPKESVIDSPDREYSSFTEKIITSGGF
ncbi:hypothetical protein Tco_0530269 [Tanacetum coccineum]